MVSLFDLNARHEAALFWIAVPLILTLIKSSDFRADTRDLLKAVAGRELLLILTVLLISVFTLTTRDLCQRKCVARREAT